VGADRFDARATSARPSVARQGPLRKAAKKVCDRFTWRTPAATRVPGIAFTEKSFYRPERHSHWAVRLPTPCRSSHLRGGRLEAPGAIVDSPASLRCGDGRASTVIGADAMAGRGSSRARQWTSIEGRGLEIEIGSGANAEGLGRDSVVRSRGNLRRSRRFARHARVAGGRRERRVDGVGDPAQRLFPRGSHVRWSLSDVVRPL
jgi:hypothetical protein